MNEIDLENAHRHSFQNRVEIEQSLKCGCFSCGRIFDATEVEDYIDDSKTAFEVNPESWTQLKGSNEKGI